MANKRKAWNPFRGELMSIQTESGSGHYTEVKDLNWSGRFPTASECLDAALEQIDNHDVDEKLAELRNRKAELQEGIADINYRIDNILDSVQGDPDLSDEKRIKEVKASLKRHILRWFGGLDPDEHLRMGINLYYKDLNRDGKLDISYAITQSHKKFVE